MKRRLESLVNSDFNKYTIMLLDSVEFLIHVDDWIENQGEQVNRIKATDFVANLISSSRNVKLLVTSSENVESLEKEKITQGPFKPAQTFQLLKTVWKNKTVYKAWADQLSDLCSHRHTGNFLSGEGGGVMHLPDILASCPIFYETVEKSKTRLRELFSQIRSPRCSLS